MNKCEICSIKKKCENYLKVKDVHLCEYINSKFEKECKDKGIVYHQILSISDKLSYLKFKAVKTHRIFDQIEKMKLSDFNKVIGFKDVKGQIKLKPVKDVKGGKK